MKKNNPNKFKYSFMIIPFKMKENTEMIIKENAFFKPVDKNIIKYERLYKHISDAIDDNNIDNSIYEYNVILHNIYNLSSNTKLTFLSKIKNKKIRVNGFLEEITMYYFTSKIGFLVFNFVFDNKTNIKDYCEILNKLKKIERKGITDEFSISNSNEQINMFHILEIISEQTNNNLDFFFQYHSKEYVSATMLNSYTFLEDEEISREQVNYYLECLKRSQGESFDVAVINEERLNAFSDIYWGFSGQGIGNINISSEKNESFLSKFYTHVRQEYLLMALILLNQEFTMIDYCINFTLNLDEDHLMKENDRLHTFQIKNTFSTPSHLEHYRQYYKMFYDKLNIKDLLEEVERKQNAIYQKYQRAKEEEKSLKEKRKDQTFTIVSILISALSVFSAVADFTQIYYLKNNVVPISAAISLLIIAILLLCMPGLKLKISDKKSGKKNKNNKGK